MNEYLTRKVYEIRRSYIKNPINIPIVSLDEQVNGVYQLLFSSCGCENACTFCNYGFDYNLTLDMVKPELLKISLEEHDILELEVESNASVLSEREIPYDLFLEILHFISNKNIPNITMETHYKTITEKKIKDIRAILGENQKINFELGFESASERVRKIFNKDLNIEEYLDVIKLCKKYEIGLKINVLLGAPFLTREEQIQDCIDSLEFIFSEMPEETIAVLFPINIKKGTMVKYWQDIGLYEQISSWEFVELIYRIPEKYLNRCSIAWWGNRNNTYERKDFIQSPRCCKKCEDRLQEFYYKFFCNQNSSYRRKLVEELWNSRCHCDKT